MWSFNLSDSFSALGQSAYNFFFSSDPGYQPLSAKPWHEAALAPIFWFATLQMRLEEIVAGIEDGSLASHQLAAACDDLIGMVASNTVKPTEFIYELERVVTASEDADFPAALTSLPNRLVAYLQADQAWALSCLQAELADGGISDQQILVVLDFYRQVIDVRLFKPVVMAIIECADRSLRPPLSSIISKTGFQATPEAILAYHQWQAAQQRSGIDRDEEPVETSGFARKLLTALGRMSGFLAKNPFLALTGVFFAQSQLAFGAHITANNSLVSLDSAGDPNGKAVDVLYGVSDMRVYTDPLSQGHRTEVHMNAFYIAGNATYELSMVGGGRLPGWLEFEPSPSKVLSYSALPNISANDFGQDIDVYDDIAYVAGGTSGLFLFDVAHKNAPQNVGHLCGLDECDIRKIEVTGSLAFLANGKKGFAIVDVADPANPDFIYQASIQGRNVTGIEHSKNTIFLSANGVFIFNVTDPWHPSLISNFSLIQCNDVEVEGDVAYVVDEGNGGIIAYDISNLAAPVRLGGYLFLHKSIRDIEVLNKKVFVATKNDGFQIVNATDPSKMHILGVYSYNQTLTRSGADRSIWDIELSLDGRFAYITKADSGVVIVNITNLASPSDVAVLALPFSPLALDVHPDLIYVTDPNGQVFWILRNDYTLGVVKTWPVPDQRGRVNLDLMLTGSLGVTNVSSHFNLKVADHWPKVVSSLQDLQCNISGNHFDPDCNDTSYCFGLTVVDLDNDPVNVEVTSSGITSPISVDDNDHNNLRDQRIFHGQRTYGMAFDEKKSLLHVALGESGLALLKYSKNSKNLTIEKTWRPNDDEIFRLGFVSQEKNMILAGGSREIYVLSLDSSRNYQQNASLAVAGQPRFSSNSGIVYVVSEKEGFYVFNLTAPNNPGTLYQNNTLIGCDIKASGETVYIAGGRERSLWVVNATELVSARSIPLFESTVANTLTLTEKYAVVVGDSLQVFDLKNFSRPVSSSRLRFPGISVELLNITLKYPKVSEKTLAFVSQGKGGLEIFDITTPHIGLKLVRQYASVDDNLDIQKIIFQGPDDDADEFSSNPAIFSTGRPGVIIVDPRYGWYYTHMVKLKLHPGDQGLHRLKLMANSHGVTTTTYQQLKILNKRPKLMEKFATGSTIRKSVGYYGVSYIKVDLSQWVTDPDGDKLSFALTSFSGALVASNSREEVSRCNITSSCHTPCLKGVWLECTGAFADIGEYAYTLYADDQHGGSVSGQIRLIVETSFWNKLRQWISKRAEGYGTIAGLVIIALLIVVYFMVKRHVGKNMAEIIQAHLKSLFRNASQQDLAADGTVIKNEILAVLDRLFNKPIESITDYQIALDKLGMHCRSYIIRQQKNARVSARETGIVSLWLVFQRQLVFLKVFNLLSYHFRNTVFDEWSYLHSRALLDLVRYTVLSIFATEPQQALSDMHTISVAERRDLVGKLLQIASFGIERNAKPVAGFFAIKTQYNVLMALDWARCLKTLSVWEFTKELISRVFSVDISGILGMFM